jgi:hypothetical protein
VKRMASMTMTPAMRMATTMSFIPNRHANPCRQVMEHPSEGRWRAVSGGTGRGRRGWSPGEGPVDEMIETTRGPGSALTRK